MMFVVTSFNKVSYGDKSDELLIQGSLSSQQDPFYFLSPVPASVKLFDKINLSFFRNKLIILQYRYRLQTPYGSQTAIDGRLIIWSAWIKDDLTEIKVPKLDQEGGYKLIIEYKTKSSNETKKYEKVFYVYYVNPLTSPEVVKSKTQPPTNRTAANITPVTDRNPTNTTAKTSVEKPVRTPAKTNTNTPDKALTKTTTGSPDEGTAKSSAKGVPATENIPNGKRRVYDKRMDLRGVKIQANISPKIVPQTATLTAESSEKTVIVEKNTAPEYDMLLAESIEKKDTALFNESIRNGAGTTLEGKNGGNIFHLMNGTFASENLILMLKNKGFSINETDNRGNSPLHFAILSGENEYARSLINQGADLNIKNNLELSPLHLAVLLNDEEVVDELLKKGAEVDLKGNTGYTALHIASEMNYVEIAKNLLSKRAKNRIKTNQGLSPKTIAKIQDNNEMVKLIWKKGYDTLSS
jgi:ankyrin repeat protein